MIVPVRTLINRDPLRMMPFTTADDLHGDTFDALDFRLDADAFRRALAEVGLASDFEPPDDFDYCEVMFRFGNDDQYRGELWPRDARSLSVGDVVIVGENAYVCVALGWVPLDADTVRSFTIHDRKEE